MVSFRFLLVSLLCCNFYIQPVSAMAMKKMMEQAKKAQAVQVPSVPAAAVPGTVAPTAQITPVATVATATPTAPSAPTAPATQGATFKEKAKDTFTFDYQKGPDRCAGTYEIRPKDEVVESFGPVELKGGVIFTSNCQPGLALKFSDLKHSELTKIFGERAIVPGKYTQTNMSFTKKFLDDIAKVPFASEMFKDGSLSVVGFIGKKPALIGTDLRAQTKGSIKLQDALTLSLKSIGIKVLQGPTKDITKYVIPVEGSMNIKISTLFEALFDLFMDFDLTTMSGTLAGVCKKEWKDFLGIKGMTLSNPGVSITFPAVGTGVGITGQAKFGKKQIKITSAVDLVKPAESGFSGEFIGTLETTDIIDIYLALASAVAGSKPFSVEEAKAILPELSISNAKIVLMPKPTTLFGKEYKEGTLVTGKANVLGKNCDVFINITKTGIYGSFSLDPVDLILVKLEGLTDKKLNFSLTLDKAKDKVSGLFCDAKVAINIPPLKAISGQGIVQIAPKLTRLSDVKANLPGVGSIALDAQANLDFKNLGSAPWKFKITVKGDAAQSLGKSMQDSLNKVKDCFK